jgi:hypothetical protein
MAGDLITFGVGPQGSITRLLTFGLEIGEEGSIWAPVSGASASWAVVSGAGGTWTPVAPAEAEWS